MKYGFFCLWFLTLAALPDLFAAPVDFALPKVELPGRLGDLTLGLLWTGSWDLKGSLVNRGDLRINALGFSSRAQVIDKRPSRFWEAADRFWEEGDTRYSGGLYHNRTGSRLLYGMLEEWGLSARLRNPWGKSLSFPEAHKSLGADLRTEPSATRENELYLYLRSPRIGPLRGFVSGQICPSRQTEGGTGESLGRFAPALGGGMDALFTKKTQLRLEGFYTEKQLSPRRPSTWFSSKPPLPERDFRLYGLGLFFTAPYLSLTADGAYSETFAWGRGWYGKGAFSFGIKPWRFSLGADAGNGRYADRDGSAVGAGFRSAAAFEWKGAKSSLLRLNGVLRASALGEPLNRISGGGYYHFPSTWGIRKPILICPVKLSFTAGRNAQDPERILDSLEGTFGMGFGVVQANLQTALKGLAQGSALDAQEDGWSGLSILSPASSYHFDSLKVSGELGWRTGPLQFRVKLGRTASAPGETGAEPVWDGSVYASIRGKIGRFSLKISSPKLPESWTVGVSWRLQTN